MSQGNRFRPGALLIGTCCLVSIAVWQLTIDISAPSGSDASIASNAIPTSPTKPSEVTAPALQSEPRFREGADFTAADRSAMQQIQFRFTAGDYDAALKLAVKLHGGADHSLSFQAWLTEQMPALLLSTAWFKIQGKDCENALPLLERAQRFRRTPEGDKGLAYCYYQMKQTRTAIEYLQQYLERSPQDQEMLMVYADALESDGRFSDAAKALERVESAMDASQHPNENLSKRRKSLTERAKEGQQQLTITTRHFALTYRTPDHDDLAPAITDLLESSLDEFLDDYHFVEPRGLIEVVLYPHESFSKVVQYGPEWAQGIFDGRMRIPVRPGMALDDEFAALTRVLRHELVHALFAEMVPARQQLPAWFNEGMAQRLECRRPCPNPRRSPQRGQFLDRDVFTKPYTSFAADLAKRSYEQSLFLVRTIESNLDRDDTLRTLVQHLRQGVADTESDTILKPLRLDFAELHKLAQSQWDH